MYKYSCQVVKNLPQEDINSYKLPFGINVISRNENGEIKDVEISLLTKNKTSSYYLVGDFNKFGENLDEEFKFIENESGISTLKTDKLKHKSKYKILIVNENKEKFFIQDPAGVYFDDFGNNILWDFESPQAYKQKYDFVDLSDQSIRIIQSDLPGLITHYSDEKGICGKDLNEKESYKFITKSGVISRIKELGFNAIQFLPFTQSIDGDNWKFRYLTPFQYAIQKNWGTPDEFSEMIDEFHKNGIAVISDAVLGHLPDRKYNIFGGSSNKNGIHHYRLENYHNLYLGEETSWGTRRIRQDIKEVRDFFTNSCISFMKHYKIDGFRIDNVDGIIREGENGEGEEREFGRIFLREVISSIYSFNKNALISLESHYFFGDNSKMLVAPQESDKRALGATAYSSSRLTYFFHKELMLKTADEISIWKIKHIVEEQDWGCSSSTIADFHNHDAAAGLMIGRATGSYAYDCMIVTGFSNHIHAVGKIKIMEAIISFAMEGRTLNLLQSFLLQEGTFEHDSSIHWQLEFREVSRAMVEFKKQINNILKSDAFNFENLKNRKFLNVDDKNKILVIQRKSSNEEYIIVINISANRYFNYKVGVEEKTSYENVFNSDEFRFAGFGLGVFPKFQDSKESSNFELLKYELEIDQINPYQVLVYKNIFN